MADSWFHAPFAFLKSYPETLLSIAIFLYLLYLPRRNGNSRVPVNWPVIGMVPAMLSHLHDLHDFVADALHDVDFTFTFRGPWFSGMDLLITSDPENVNYIHSVNFSNYPKGKDFNDMFEILGETFFGADGESWKVQRKIAQSFLADRSYRTFVANTTRDKAVHGILPILEHVAESGGTVDLQDVFMRSSFDITCFMVFGVDPGCLSLSFPMVPIMMAIDDLWEAILTRHTMPKWMWKTLKWLKIGEEGKLAAASIVIDDFAAKQIAERREEIRQFKLKYGADQKMGYNTNLLASYIDSGLEEISRVFENFNPDKFLRDTVLTLMIAGRDGFAITLSWLFYLLSKNPHAEAKILEELRQNRAKKPGSTVFDPEDFSNMVYFHGAVCETLRLYPPVPYETKTARDYDELPSGHKVQPRTKLVFAAYAMGRMESVWGDDCREFKPERWIGENGKPKHVPAYKFMAFNAGPRICPGREVALVQIKTITATVLWNFEIDMLKENVVAAKNSVMIRMVNPLMVRAKKRVHSI